MRRVVLLTTLSALLMVAAGCRHDGRTLRPARPDQNQSISTTTLPPTLDGGSSNTDVTSKPTTTTPDSASTTGTSPSSVPDSSAASTSAPGHLTMTAPWKMDETIPNRFTCDDTNVSPALSWSKAPAGTKSIALTMLDIQDRTYVHWVLVGLPATATSIAENTVPVGAHQATNGAGDIGYTGPCPPAGSTHHYVFAVHYLRSTISLGDGTPGDEMTHSIQTAELRSAVVRGSYSRL